MPDISIVIAHRGDPMGLWATIHACEVDLDRTGISANYVIVPNGFAQTVANKHQKYLLKRVLHFLEKTKRLKHVEWSQEPLSPPSARQLGTKFADGELLAFFDNHVLIGRDYFRRVMIDFEKYPSIDKLNSSVVFYAGEFVHYHYKLTLAKNFWAAASTFPERTHKPYRIAMGAHGAFVVKRKVWEEIGGYWDGFRGYAGEETYLDLKLALLDKENWIDPLLIHYHYAAPRGYPRHCSDDFFRNLMACANIIGGEEWMFTVYNSFTRWVRFINREGKTMYDFLMEAYERSKEHAAYMASIRHRTLDEQLKYFKRNAIAYR